MLSTCEGGSIAAPGTGGEEPGSPEPSGRRREAQCWEERPRRPGAREHGDKYEGEIVDGLKHGKGRYTWSNGEYYEGCFYKDYKHGDAVYCWPTGHKFIGKFYLNRREGYATQLFSDGSTFKGLYFADQKFGPGVFCDPNGHEDVGLWYGDRLLKLCSALEGGFSLKQFPEYAAYVEPANNNESSTQVNSGTVQHIDDIFILPQGIEHYSTDGDHLPLPPGRRKELDQLFFGELWEPDPYQGYKRYPLSDLPLEPRMQAHIHKHRLLAKNVDWDVAAVLSLNRGSFGPKGSLEVNSELLIQHASKGDPKAILQILKTGLIHPDVSDSLGNTALIAATINCHNNVINLLLDVGVDIDKLNCEGMSALAICHVLCYPFQSLHTTFAKPETQAEMSLSAGEIRSRISQVTFVTDTPPFDSRPEIIDSALNETNHSPPSEHDDNCTQIPELNEPDIFADTDHLQIEQRNENDEEEADGKTEDTENESPWKESEHEDICAPSSEEEESEAKRNDEEGVLERIKSEIDNDLCNTQKTEDSEGRIKENVNGEDVEEKGFEGLEQGNLNQDETEGKVQQERDQELTTTPSCGGVCLENGFDIKSTEEVIQQFSDGHNPPQHTKTEDTALKMSSLKISDSARLETLKLLLERGADPNACRVPMPVLFLAIMAADIPGVRRLLLCGARTDIRLPVERKGLYPLHVAAGLPSPAGPRITELLLHTLVDPDTQACDQDEIYEPGQADSSLSSTVDFLKGGGRTALHMACQRESGYKNASEVVALLLAHGANPDLLWSGHSPLSLAIASGNDLAVEELLKGGANPNLPLGVGVGSALCAVANFNYHLTGDRIKLLDLLVRAGADILMPVKVDGIMGSAVDYAHHSFNQDSVISHTPFHILSKRQKETFKSRQLLLRMMADELRWAARLKQRARLEQEQHLKSNRTSVHTLYGSSSNCEGQEFRFCYHCCRSVSVKLTACNRCFRVYYCSQNCKIRSWNKRHKQECFQESAPADGAKKTAMLKFQERPKRMTATLKSNKDQQPVTMDLKSKRIPESMNKAEEHINLKENYSFI